MKSQRKLNELREGESGTISAVMPSNISERLKELGFTVGTAVECRCRSFSGDPSAYSVKGTVIALRKNDAESVVINA